MEVITIESEAFSKLILNIERLTNALSVQYSSTKNLSGENQKTLNSKSKDPDSTWLDTEDVCKVLKVTKRTIQKYRDTLILPYSQVGKKILYKQSDIQKLLESNYYSIDPP